MLAYGPQQKHMSSAAFHSFAAMPQSVTTNPCNLCHQCCLNSSAAATHAGHSKLLVGEHLIRLCGAVGASAKEHMLASRPNPALAPPACDQVLQIPKVRLSVRLNLPMTDRFDSSGRNVLQRFDACICICAWYLCEIWVLVYSHASFLEDGALHERNFVSLQGPRLISAAASA